MSVNYEEGRRLLANFREGKNQEGFVLFLLHYAEALLNPVSAAPDGEEVKRLKEALRWYADRSNYNDIPLPIGTSQEFRYDPAPAVKDGGKRARAALNETGQ